MQVLPDSYIPQRVNYSDDNDSQVEVIITNFTRKTATARFPV